MSVSRPIEELNLDNPVLMAQVVAGFVQGRTATDISETLGIPRKRISRWYRDSEMFRDMLSETQGAVIDQIRSEVVSQAVDEVTNLLPTAVSVLAEAMQEGKMSEKIAAAAHVMRFSGAGNRKDGPKAGPSPEDLIRGARGPATGD